MFLLVFVVLQSVLTLLDFGVEVKGPVAGALQVLLKLMFERDSLGLECRLLFCFGGSDRFRLRLLNLVFMFVFQQQEVFNRHC
jgi:hypothetical protein